MKEPDLSDISLRDLTARHVKAGYSNVYKYAIALEAENEQLLKRVDGLEGALEQIAQWAKAYPLDVFPEPDFKKAAKVLKDADMTLGAISASNMRHVVEGVGQIAKAALAQPTEEAEEAS